MGSNSRINYGLNLDYSETTTFGNITLSQGSIIDVNGEQQGEIRIQGSNLLLTDDSLIDANNNTVNPGKTLSITTSDSVELVGNSIISIQPLGAGDGSSLNLTTGTLTLRDGALIVANVDTNATGEGGDIFINATELVELKGQSPDDFFASVITAGTFSNFVSGKAGNITILAKNIRLQDGGQITTTTEEGSAANGGNITVKAAESLEISGNSQGGQQSAGLSAQSTPNSTGNSGNITVDTKHLSLTDGAQISTSTFSSGNGGEIVINARDSVEIQGGAFSDDGLRFNSGVFSVADFLDINEAGDGDGGNITINAQRIVVDEAQITAATFTEGNGGSVILNVGQLLIKNGAEIGAATDGAGNGGTITVNARDFIEISGTGQIFNEIVGNNISSLFAASTGTGEAGNIQVRSGNLSLDDSATLSTETASGKGGNIAINLDGVLSLRNGSTITATAGTAQAGGDGGNITIRADFILARATENSDISANAFTGRGGNVNLTTQALFGITPREQPTPLSDITASSRYGASGIIAINNPSVPPQQGLASEDSNPVDPSTLIAQNVCQKGIQSEFILTGRGGLPPVPIAPLSRQIIWENIANSEVIPKPLREATDWQINSIGEVVLVVPVNLADAHNNQGNIDLQLGRAQSALLNFKQAESLYHQDGNEEGRVYSILNQAYALQALGLNLQAFNLLNSLYQNQQKQPDSLIKVAVYRHFGEILQLVGNLQLSESVLKESLTIAQNNHYLPEIEDIYLNLGNLARLTAGPQALSYYQNSHSLQAQLNQLSYLVEQNQTQGTTELINKIQAQITNLPISQAGIYARLNYAHSLSQLSRIAVIDIMEILTIAREQARELGDKRAEAYSLGYLGQLYQQNNQLSEAEDLTEQALVLSEQIQAPEIAYIWQWQLGKIFQRQKNREQAIKSYNAAYQTLGKLRQELAGINSEAQFSFRATIEPIYRELVGLLLEKNPTQAELQQSRNVIESLQLAQLNNFFQDSCTSAKPQQIEQIDTHAAVLYSIVLPGRLELIFSVAGQPLRHRSIAVTTEQIERVYNDFMASLNPYIIPENHLRPNQQLYDWLIRPFAKDLKTHNIHTIVTVLDGVLQGTPLAALHDGQQYLIENYSLALTPGLQLLESSSASAEKGRILLAGLTESRQGFSSLPGVVQELKDISGTVRADILLNKEFTSPRLQRELRDKAFSLVHLATHGQFSSVAEDTFLLTWDGKIKVNELEGLLQRRLGIKPIELLVLSACQTATGDNRAALGLAGIAVRSGARSTIATLWSIEDQSTAELMKQFYVNLSQPGQTRAEALRLAQLMLLKSSDYAHPYYWAAFVLVGHWL